MVDHLMPNIKGYIKENKYYFTVVLYFFISVFIKMLFGFDITIPCLIYTLTGIHCPGCGLTSAFIEVLRLNITEAFRINPIIFIAIPSIVISIVIDFSKYKINV